MVSKEYVVGLAVKNEEENVEYMIKELRKFGFYNIFLMDEQSTDKTVKIAKKLKIKVYQRKKKGFGAGIIAALQCAYDLGYKYMIRLDCDGSYPPKDLPKLLKFSKDYDLVTGYRPFKEVKFLHRLPNYFFTNLTKFVHGGEFKDVNCGMKIFKLSKYHKLLDALDWDNEIQIAIRTIKNNLSYKQIPIDFKERSKGNSKIRVKDGFTILKRIFIEL